MANAKDICLWLDDRWYDALQKHLKNETVEDKLNEYLDELINQLPEREYERISREIYEEAQREQATREAARVFTAFRIREFGDTKLFKVEGETDLLSVGNSLRSYTRREDQDGFAKGFRGTTEISQEEYDHLTQVRLENTGKVAQVYDIDMDAGELSALHIMDGWKTFRSRDVCTAAYYAMKKNNELWIDRFSTFIDRLDGKELTASGIPLVVHGTRPLAEQDVSFSDEVILEDGKLNFYLESSFDVDAVFGTHVCTEENDDWLNVYAEYDIDSAQVDRNLILTLCRGDGTETTMLYSLTAQQREMLDRKMSEYCEMPVAEYAERLQQEAQTVEESHGMEML